MQSVPTRLLLAALLLISASTPVTPQTPAQVAQTPLRNLAEFEGHYEYRDGLTLFMVANKGQLTAIIGDSKYVLRAAGTDAFLNPPGDSIPFVRDANGRIVAFKEYGDEFARLSSKVPAATRLLLEPRPKGPDGLPVVYRYAPPTRLPDGIRVGEAGPATLPPKVAEQLVNGVIDGTYPDVRSILVYRKGVLLLEEYFYGFDHDRPHEMRSFTKSVISLLAGVAVDRGLLRADEPVLARLGYPAYGNPDPRKAKVTLTDLLSSQSGFACNEHDRSSPGIEANLFETQDWAKAFVDLPMAADPGTVGSYCSGGFYTAGRIIERATGKPLPEFADEALFGPLGIRRADWKWNFTLDRSQRNEFGQVYLRPRDMLKLGILIQDRGEWKGNRVVSASWIDAAVARQSRVDDSDYGLGIWHRWYGVQTSAGDRRVDTIMLTGNGGQKVGLVPSLDLIVVTTGSAYFVESPVNEMMARVLLPALMETTSTDGPKGDKGTQASSHSQSRLGDVPPPLSRAKKTSLTPLFGGYAEK
jgi:CubicO group peptidase (beta-lactamase class C family)